MSSFVLYCKSYRTDLFRVRRLAESIAQFNTEDIPFHVSVPETDIALFKQHLQGFRLALHTDEDILKAAGYKDLSLISGLRGAISQQIVKSSFWHLNSSDMYLCLDSDAVFLRPFTSLDFVHPDGTPYTVLDEAHELIDDARKQGKQRIIDAFMNESGKFKELFSRSGRNYSFGPFPVVWHRDVWKSLDSEYLQPRGLTLAAAIQMAPVESRWYGEALLKYRAVPLLPCQAFFKVYHYAWQYDADIRHGVTPAQLASDYVGAIYQSAWERQLDWPQEGGNFLSRTGRRIRRRLRRI